MAHLPRHTSPPSCPSESRVPKADPGSHSSLQWEGAEIQRTPWLSSLDKQAQGGCKGGGGCRGLHP